MHVLSSRPKRPNTPERLRKVVQIWQFHALRLNETENPTFLQDEDKVGNLDLAWCLFLDVTVGEVAGEVAEDVSGYSSD